MKKTIKFIDTDFLGKNVKFNFEEIGTIYPGDDTVYIHGNPVRISSVEVKIEKLPYNKNEHRALICRAKSEKTAVKN